MLSCIIPSRSDQYLQQTVDDLLAKAEGEVEVIVVADGIWPALADNPKVTLVHHGQQHDNYGMRASINLGMRLARGEYVMKIDEQCAVGQGYDLKLVADCEDNWVVIPRRERLEPESWNLTRDNGDTRPPIDYMILDYPYQRPLDKTCGLHGAEIKLPDKVDILIDDVMTMQGSCYFMKKSYWEELFPNGLDDVNYGTFTQEAQEISNSVWLSGGRLVVNKKTWYAHWHKGSKGKGYGFSNAQYRKHLAGTERGRLYCIDYWCNDRHLVEHPTWHSFEWLISKFAPPGWPENWQQQIKIDAANDFSSTYAGKEYEPTWTL